MTITSRINTFLAREDGAMSTDFVVLTGGILLFGMVVVASLVPQFVDFSDQITKVTPENKIMLQFVNPTVVTN